MNIKNRISVFCLVVSSIMVFAVACVPPLAPSRLSFGCNEGQRSLDSKEKQD